MKVRLSYIIPIYNGEKYLRPCLDSFYQQGLTEDEFEVICVDDCSSDKSVELLKYYATNHKNIRILQHDHNMRTGTSCNQGLQVAKGDYIWIVGQDDWIEDNYAKQLVELADEHQMDVLPFNYNRVNHTGDSLISKTKVFEDSDIMKGEAYVRRYFYESFGVYILGYEWRAIYRRQFVLDNGITFPEGMLFEDTTFMFKAIWKAERIKSISDYVYNYRLNDASITDYRQRYKGYPTFEFSFRTSAEMLSLAQEEDDKRVAEILRSTALKSMKSFAYKVVPMTLKEKNIFYSNVANNWTDIKEQVRMMPIAHRMLIRPVLGKLLSIGLKPIFLVKHMFVQRTYIHR